MKVIADILKKHWKPLVIGVLILAIVAVAIVVINQKETKYIAYVGRHNDSASELDHLQETVLNHYLTGLNDNLSHYKLKLLLFRNLQNAESCKEVYEAIAANEDILFTIDNSWASEITKAREVIKDHNLPVFFLNADRNNLDFGTSTLFIGNADNFPRDVTAFLHKILKSNLVVFLSEKDYAMHGPYLQSFSDSRIGISDTIEVYTQQITELEKHRVFDRLKSIYKDESNRKNLPLVINTHSKWSKEVLSFVEKQFPEITIVGADYTTANLNDSLTFNNIQLFTGNHPTDALSNKLTDDLKFFRDRDEHNYFKRKDAAYFINRCLTVVDIVTQWIVESDNMELLNSKSAANFVEGLRTNVFIGKENIYSFDSIGTLTRDTYFTHLRHGKFFSIPLQINQNHETIPNITFGMDIIDIYDVNINASTFSSDFFYWIRMDTLFKEFESDIMFYNMKQSESHKDLLITQTEEQFLYKLYKVSGLFHNSYMLKDYPIDLQELKIQVDILKPADKLRISFDQQSYEQDSSVFERFRVPAWKKLRYDVTVDNRISKNMRGAYDSTNDTPLVYKSFIFRLEIERKFMKPFLEIILPLILITLVSVSVMFVKDLSFATIGQVSVGAFLGIITFSIALAVNSPAADYLTKTDLFFWLSFIVIFLSFINVIYINHIYDKKQLKIIRLNRLKYTILIAYPILTMVIFWY